MKIDVSSIVRDHIDTLYDARSNRKSKLDLLVFYGIPVVISFCAYYSEFKVTKDVYNVSITFFGIFIALLLNIQVAMFSIFQRKWDVPNDERMAQIQRDTLEDRKQILTELNANISYLILVSCCALVAVLIFYVQNWNSGIAPVVALFFYGHFILTLVMIVKRSHALFQKEYRDSPD
jgi:hydrogenase-4 membrane subunit HyfE